jgi:uncharacterized protein (DUF1778 family)
MSSESEVHAATPRRRNRRRAGRGLCRIAISVDAAEQAALEQVARDEGLTVSAFVAVKALAAARNTVLPTTGELREFLADLNRATLRSRG